MTRRKKPTVSYGVGDPTMHYGLWGLVGDRQVRCLLCDRMHTLSAEVNIGDIGDDADCYDCFPLCDQCAVNRDDAAILQKYRDIRPLLDAMMERDDGNTTEH